MPRTPKQFEEIRKKTRRKIVESSLKLFATKGYHGASIHDIAKEAGISKGLAYNYFSSKKEIMHAVLKELMDVGWEIEEEIDWDGDPYLAIRKVISETFELIEQNKDFWRMYFSFAMQPAVSEESKDISDEFSKMMFKRIESAFKKMGLPNAKEEAKILAAIIDGLCFHYFYIKDYPLRSTKNYLLKKYSKEELDKIKK